MGVWGRGAVRGGVGDRGARVTGAPARGRAGARARTRAVRRGFVVWVNNRFWTRQIAQIEPAA